MDKKKIAMAFVAAAVSASACADPGPVDIYGVASMSLDSIDNGSGPSAATRGTRTTKVSSDASRIGFRGGELLGDGYQAIWQIESTVDLDGSGSSTFATRNSFLGLQSAMGTLLAGRHDSPYKMSTRKLDVFGLVLADNRTLMGGVTGKSAFLEFDSRKKDTVVYKSPVLDGFSLNAGYAAGAEAASRAGEVKGAVWSVAGMYKLDGLYATLAYESHKLGSPATGDLAGGTAGVFAGAGSWESAAKMGIGYQTGSLKLGLVYEKTHDNLGGSGATGAVAACAAVGADCYGHHAVYVAARYAFGQNGIALAYTRAGHLAGARAGTDTGAKQLSLGVDHSLGKHTLVYALYTRLQNGADINYALASTTWTTGATAAAGNGATLSGLSLGMKHTF